MKPARSVLPEMGGWGRQLEPELIRVVLRCIALELIAVASVHEVETVPTVRMLEKLLVGEKS